MYATQFSQNFPKQSARLTW